MSVQARLLFPLFFALLIALDSKAASRYHPLRISMPGTPFSIGKENPMRLTLLSLGKITPANACRTIQISSGCFINCMSRPR